MEIISDDFYAEIKALAEKIKEEQENATDKRR